MVEGRQAGMAVVDTGGGYEVMLRERFGLAVVDTVDVIAFGGVRRVDVTEEFTYHAGGVHGFSGGAIIGEAICGCNGLGFEFFRRTGMVLALDFENPTVTFLDDVPDEGVTVKFNPPPEPFRSFDTAFIEVRVSSPDRSMTLPALLDTGATATVIRRGLFPTNPVALAIGTGELSITIAHPQLGTATVEAAVFDNNDLPEMIIGTDVMRALGKRWYFSFPPYSGSVTIVKHDAAVATAEPQQGSLLR